MIPLQRRVAIAVILSIATLSIVGRTYGEPAGVASDVIEQSGVSAGFFVHLGAGDGKLTAALRQADNVQVHGLIRDADSVDEVRTLVRSAGDYGDIAFDSFSGSELPYVDNLVNLLVTENLGDVPLEEVLRVLVPDGVAMIKQSGAWEKIVKPRPENIDDWSHYLHDATGNSVAHDDVVAPPRHLQWVGSPRWSRHHDRMASMSALVSAGGRLFYIMDEGSPDFDSVAAEVEARFRSRRVQRHHPVEDATSADWQSHLWPLKSGPSQSRLGDLVGD